MSSGKPPIAVKPTNIQLSPKSPHPMITSPKPSVSELRKNLEKILPVAFPDAPKNEAARSRSVDIKLDANTVLHKAGNGGLSRSRTAHNGQGKKETINGVELCRLNFHRRATVPSETIPSSDSVSVVAEKEANEKNARENAKAMGRDSQNSESTNGHSEEDSNADVYLYSPVSMLMKQILDSVEMPVVHFNALPETELVQLLSLYDEDIDKARIHCISTWNDMINELLESTGYSTSDSYRNIASLIFCKVDLDFKVASKCLGNDRVKIIITRHVSRLEERSQQLAHRYGDKGLSAKNPDIWNAVVEDVMATSGWENYLEFTIEQKCQICWEAVPSDKIFGLSICQCVVCNSCIKQYFEVMIRDGYVANFICPVCHLPDVEDASLHFQMLEPKLKRLLSAEDFGAYQRKLTEWNLVRNPNFHWCINAACRFGFLIEENGYSRVCCPECSVEMCHRCKRPWEQQHMGLSCEQFKDWKKSNDPEFQEDALRQQLQENGIDCPGCRRRYLLSKGGCIHFTCSFCHYEFCSSCSRRFVRSCERSNHCEQSGGLHCHHPRNCLYYLRDRSVDELQTLLESNNVSYEKSQQTSITTCPVVEEQDADTGYTRQLCKARSFLPGHDGFCEKHYKEYLAGIIQRSRIDPTAIMSQGELTRELQNHGITDIPTQLHTETKNQYLYRLRKMVIAKVMLPRQDRRCNDQLQ